MFPAGKLIFLRPIKMKAEKHPTGKEPKIKQAWDAIWSTPEELIAEGILVSKKVPKMGPKPRFQLLRSISHLSQHAQCRRVCNYQL